MSREVTVRVWWTASLIAACRNTPVTPEDDDPREGVTTDAPADPPRSDSDPAPFDTDSPASLDDPADTAPQADSAIPSRGPPTMGPGFVDVSGWPAEARIVERGVFGNAALSPVVAADLDGDGHVEVIASQVVRPGDAPHGKVVALRYDPATGSASIDDAWTAALPGGTWVHLALDLDDDGHVDLVGGDISQRGVLLGTGAPRFDAAAVSGLASAEASPGTDLVTVADVDRDGWLDLLVADSVCDHPWARPILPVLRTGPRRWEARPELVRGPPRQGGPFGVALVTLGTDLRLPMFYGHPCTPSSGAPGFVRETGRDSAGWPVFEPFDPMPADALFRVIPLDDDQYPGARPMGVVSVDLDADGLLDLVTSPSLDLLLVALGTGTTTLRAGTIAANLRLPQGPKGSVQLPWGVGAVDLDRDGHPDLVVALGDDSFPDVLDAGNGPFAPSAWWNRGDATFVEATVAAGLDRIVGNWRTLVVTDLDDDGDPDPVLGGHDALPRVLRNDIDVGRGMLGLRLRGTTSNHVGHGAIVTFEARGLPPQVRVMGEVGTPMGFSDLILHVAVGDAVQVDRVHVQWPSGHVQQAGPLALGRVHVLEEPPTITLSEADRHAPADGASIVAVVVAPRTPDGAIRPDLPVALTLEGTGTVRGPGVPQADGSVRFEVVAPETPGTCRLEARVDGVPLPIAPRLWWDPASSSPPPP